MKAASVDVSYSKTPTLIPLRTSTAALKGTSFRKAIPILTTKAPGKASCWNEGVTLAWMILVVIVL